MTEISDWNVVWRIEAKDQQNVVEAYHLVVSARSYYKEELYNTTDVLIEGLSTSKFDLKKIDKTLQYSCLNMPAFPQLSHLSKKF